MSLIKAIKKSSKTQVFIAEKLNKDYEERTNKEDNKSIHCFFFEVASTNTGDIFQT